ncbi:hypothetical protein DIPPA_19910 [Diplonema papillatum]|nr:hypothetical protein DIPPA_19910 [Diplonema papillatum]
MSGEWEWHGHSVKTPAKDHPKDQGEWLELATGCEALWNKGESLEDLLFSLAGHCHTVSQLQLSQVASIRGSIRLFQHMETDTETETEL